ncbi:uncharacterized protein LOC134534575 [Bacillus rossius redtenbacheri]|uniref:uncharacterized protein LOC134534575 n=1 Tax=Bacillus rossius redtenbacheri TaxID=93214 RepID=UPI002FDF0053
MNSTVSIVLAVIIVAACAVASPLEAKEEAPPHEAAGTSNATAAATAAAPREARNLDNDVAAPPPREASLVQKLNAKCSQRDVPSCMMLKLVTYMNRLLKKSKIEVGGGLEIEKTSEETAAAAAAAAADDADDGGSARSGEEPAPSDEAELAELLTDKAWSFVRSRRLTWRMLPDADLTVSSAPDRSVNVGMSIRPDGLFGTGRGKKKNNFGGIIAAVVLKAGLLAGLAFKALVLLVGKAILVSKIALVLAIILWLKKLLSQERHVTYEVVAHPHHSHSHVVSSAHGGGGGGIEAHGGGGGDSYSSGWGRSLDAQELAYRGHVPAPAPAPASASASASLQ